ncbi:uncharacterized protein LOC119642272 [Glossina fuscipes]|uniref:Uncharacterized protein LOC119642272 n=1 Tax=Glossina fuscipes TaxID=7396 RepID=A0A9C5ZJC7_9MUSC|nr:uncharacterized protein LOC119642272 [Glossina fuscipes]
MIYVISFDLYQRLHVDKAVTLARLEEEYQSKFWGRVEWSHDLNQQESQARLAAAVLFVHLNRSDCVENVQKSLDGMGLVDIDRNEGRVIVHTVAPWSRIQEKIENTGRKAVLAGFGGQSAVSIINNTGSDVDHTSIQRVVRFTAITNDQPGVVVDGVIDGL